MKPRKTAPTRKRAPLPDGVNKRLSAYALAAGAGALSVLALAPSAKADTIVYTPANQTLTNGTLSIDLNHDGINDFQLTNVAGSSFRTFRARPLLGLGTSAK